MKKLMIATALTLAAVSAMPANAGAATRSQTCWVSDGFFGGHYARCRGTIVSYSYSNGRTSTVPGRGAKPAPQVVNFRPDNPEAAGGAGGGGGGGGGGR